MIQKTEGIVLRSMPYQENKLICTLYTRNSGMMSFVMRMARSPRGKSKQSHFQPLSIIELVYHYHENRSLQKLTESRILIPLHRVHTDPIRLSIGLAMIEIFYDCVKEEEPNPQLYDFLHDLLLRIEQAPNRVVHLFIFYLTHFTWHLGFFPSDQTKVGHELVQFRLKEGVLRNVSTGGSSTAKLLKRFLDADMQNCREITFDRQEKRQMITKLFEYYQLHIDGFRYPKTLQVFAEVFG